MARPAAAAALARSLVGKSAITDNTAMAKPMQFRMSTRNRSLQGAGMPKMKSCTRNANARKKRYPERRNAVFTRASGAIPLRSELSIRNPSVTPVRNRKMAGGMPPRNCEKMYGPRFLRSSLRKESHT